MRVAVIVVALAGVAAAKPQVISARLDGELAHITVRQTVLRTERGTSLETVDVPDDALVVGAHIDGHALALMPVAEADDRYLAVEDDPPQGPPAWAAKLERGDRVSVTVSLAAPAPGLATLELELVAPTCYARDARFVAVPESWVAAETDGGCGKGHWLRLPDTTLADRHGLDRLGTRATRAVLDDLHVAHLAIELPSKLGEVPADLATVILVDTSRSVGEAKFKAEAALALDYLRRAPHARVQVIAYARHPFAIVPGWRNAGEALPLVERVLATTPLRNGSNLDEALTAAQAALNTVAGTHRIIVLSDELLPGDLRVDQLRAGLAPETLVNAVVVQPHQRLTRDDDGTLSGLTAATYGVHMRGGTDAESILRPTTLDHLFVRGTGWSDLTPMTCPEQLVEGNGCTAWFQGEASASAITVEGMVWGRRVSRVLAPDLARRLDVVRELSGKRLFGDDRARQAIADQLARAVNGAWSMFARWGGAGGYALDAGGRGATGGGGTFDTISRDGFGTLGHGEAQRHVASLQSQLAPAQVACHAERDKVVVSLELTLEETVRVDVAALGGDLAAARKRDCLIDAIWDIELAIAEPMEHAQVTVTLD